MPSFHIPKQSPISLPIPNINEDDLSIYLIDKICACFPCNQFVAFIQRRPSCSSGKVWHCQPLPVPPCFHESKKKRAEFISYAVVDGGSHICFSFKGFGTYCFDTVRHTWSHVGAWTLPFHGKAEYGPELELWFGLSAEDHLFCAADLSNLDSRPQLLSARKELELPEGWMTLQGSDLVYLGSGKFCIARYYDPMFDDDLMLYGSYSGEPSQIPYTSFSVITYWGGGGAVWPCG